MHLYELMYIPCFFTQTHIQTFNRGTVVTSQNGHHKETVVLHHSPEEPALFCSVSDRRCRKEQTGKQPRQTHTNTHEPGEDQTQRNSHSAGFIGIHQTNPDTTSTEDSGNK